MDKINRLDPDLVIKEYDGNRIPPFFKYDEDEEEFIDFYNDEAKTLIKESITKVMDVYFKGRLVAYYAYTTSEIRADKLDTGDKVAPFAHPALKLGRLLVCKSFRGKGIGTLIVQEIARVALVMRKEIPLRLLAVDALPKSVAFYSTLGFVDTGIKRGKNRDLSLLYIDLNKIVL